MKKLLLLSALIVSVSSFGQEDIDPYNEASVDYFFESNPPSSDIEGKWISRLGAFYIIKYGNKFHLIGAGYNVDYNFYDTLFYKSWKDHTNYAISNFFAGDTIGTFEMKDKNFFSYKGKLLWEYKIRSSANDVQYVGTVNGRSKKWNTEIYFMDVLNKNIYIKESDKVNGIKYFRMYPRGAKSEEDYRDSNIYYKLGPKFTPFKTIVEKEGGENNNNWLGVGSGIIFSSSGLILTNNHVIDDAESIEIEIKSNGEVQKFNAEIVQKDLRNDLAILKIVDVDFDGFGVINYNFNTQSSDVGTKIYTYGYPKALSGMGSEIKITEGIISSKSGIMGDVTTYQISAPIQSGNSGGPLFDDKGNLIGINSSKFNSDETENVNYSIKSSYALNLIDVLPKSIDLPSSTKLQSLPLTEQIKEISKYVVLVKVK